MSRVAGFFFLGLFPAAWCAAACQPPGFGVQAGVENNVWREISATGQQLVREQGDLPFVALMAEISCDWGKLTLRSARTQGKRDYQGASNTGVPLTTQSVMRNEQTTLAYSYPVTSQLEPFVSLGLLRSSRDIQSAGNILGYPEEFRMFPLELGLKWRPPWPEGRLLLSAHVGMSFNPQVKVWLPGRDELLLDLGSTRSSGISAELQLGSLGGGQVFLGTQWSSTRMAASKPGVITRSGIPTGVASQPRSELTQTQVSVVWRKSL